MGRVDKTFEWCLEKGKKIDSFGKHKGLRKIKEDIEESKRQMIKADSDLSVMDYLFKGNRTDWVASAAYYAMYHSLLAILYKFGYESQNQECTITLVEKFMKDRVISLEQEYIDIIRNVQDIENAKAIREDMQYGSKTFLEPKRCKKVMDDARKFVERVRELLEEGE